MPLSKDQKDSLFIGVDVGTGSARAALVNRTGQVVRQSEKPIQKWNPQKDHFEQSSEDIWNSVCYCVKQVSSGLPKNLIKAISFDATCSLVVLDKNGKPLTVSSTGNNEQNIILWMDHRASEEAAFINDSKDEILRFVGGQVSVEMELPKLLWLKRHLPNTYKNIGYVFDLADYLTWRTSGSSIRSSCTVVCKWNYDAENSTWKKSFLQKIGLEDLFVDNCSKVGKNVGIPGEKISSRLTDSSAKDLSLSVNTTVGLGIIDAHAGALAMFGCQDETTPDCKFEEKLALISGTSTCHISMTKDPTDAKGVWGPYKNVIFPDYYLNEGGQSATGILLDTYLSSHPQYDQLVKRFKDHQSVYGYLNGLLYKMAEEKKLPDIGLLTETLHIWPDFHGNRSPIADPNLKGMICGLTLSNDESSLAIVYLALIQSLAYGTRHIINTLDETRSTSFKRLLFCGGVAKNNVYVKCHADICGLPALVPYEKEKVLIGAAILAANASGEYKTLEEAALHMGGIGRQFYPAKDMNRYHNNKYKVFLKMLEDQKSYHRLMNER